MEKPENAQENKLEELQKAGIEAYRKKDYEAALEHFTAVCIPLLTSIHILGMKLTIKSIN